MRILHRLYGSEENGHLLETNNQIQKRLGDHKNKDGLKEEERELITKVLENPGKDKSMNFPKHCPVSTYSDGSTF